MTHYEALAHLVTLSGAQSFLEVGVQEGGSLRAVLEANPGIQRLLLCDTWDGSHGGTSRGSHRHISMMLDELEWDGTVTYLDGRSQDSLPKAFMARFDVTHVDGGHSYREALQDLQNVWPRTGQAMLVHDATFPQVWRACSDFSTEHPEAEAMVAFGDEGSIIFRRRQG